MTVTATETLTTADRRRSARRTPPAPGGRRRAPHRVEARGAWILMAPYAALFLVAAAIPIGYAFSISLQKDPTIV